MIEELARHDYKVSAGTLYPLLYGMKRDGYLTSRKQRADERTRRVYRATAMGRQALEQSKGRIRELFKELVQDS